MAVEHPVETIPVEMQGLTIGVPVDHIVEPTEKAQALMNKLEDPQNWKNPIPYQWMKTSKEACELADCYDFYLGGHERDTQSVLGTNWYGVASRGYYHYIGG